MRWERKDEKFKYGVSMKNPIFMGGGGVMKNQCMGRFPKGETLDSLQILRGGGGLAKKRRVVFLRGSWYPNTHYEYKGLYINGSGS